MHYAPTTPVALSFRDPSGMVKTRSSRLKKKDAVRSLTRRVPHESKYGPPLNETSSVHRVVRSPSCSERKGLKDPHEL